MNKMIASFLRSVRVSGNRNIMVKRTINKCKNEKPHLVGVLCDSVKFVHYALPCHNLLDKDLLGACSDAFNESLRFGVGKDERSSTVDRCGALVESKILWNKTLQKLTPEKEDREKAFKYLREIKKGKTDKLDGKFSNYLRHFANDPEPCFEGNHNWLYTGGNISGITHSNEYYIFSANEMDTASSRRQNNGKSVVLNEIQLDSNLDDVARVSYHRMKYNSPILQVMCHKNESENVIVGVRQRKCLTVMKYMGPTEMSTVWSNTEDCDAVLINFDFGPHGNIIAVTDSYRELRLFDYFCGREVFHYQRDKSLQPWSQVISTESENEFYLADPKTINIIDSRVVDGDNPVLKIEPGFNVEKCEEITSVTKSEGDRHAIYVACVHNVLQIDRRNGKDVQRWTHLLKSPIQFGKTDYKDSEEIVFLQSRAPEEMIAITNEDSLGSGRFTSRSTPRLLPTAKNWLDRARFRGVGLHPLVSARLNFSVTGLEVLRGPTGRLHIFTANGGGDIVRSKLRQSSEEEVNPDEELDRSYRRFDDHLERLHADEPRDHATKLSREIIWKKLAEGCENRKRPSQAAHHWKYDEMFSPESLCYTRDHLSEKLLSVWNVRSKGLLEDDEEEEEEEDGEDDEEARRRRDELYTDESVKERVFKWMSLE